MTAGPGDNSSKTVEHLHMSGHELAAKVKELIHEGNVRHLVIKHDGHTIVEIPVTIGVASVVLAPALAAVAAIGAAVTNCTVEVTREV